MGKLTKAKIDEIKRLRNEGYTQRETAEKAGVHPRTIRKYDPLRQQRSEERSVEKRLLVLEEAMRVCWDYIDLLYWAMYRSATGDSLERETYSCPRCSGKLRFDEEEVTFFCSKCGHKFSRQGDWCYHCLSTARSVWSDEIDNLVCPGCGARLY